MSRAQALVVRGRRILLVQHRTAEESYWCLPGGGIEAGEAPEAAAVRELFEECGMRGVIVAPTAVTTFAPGDQHFTFRIEVGDQEPTLGHDPELAASSQIIVAVAWKALDEVAAIDRVYFWTAGLLTVPGMLDIARSL